MNQQELNKILELHKKWLNNEKGGLRANLQRADLQGANLQGANLQGANLQGANLQRANIGFSCFPIWCGGLNFKIDERQAKQLMYHVINLMQYSGLNVNKVIKKEMFKWLSDSHLITKHNLPVLEEIE